MNIKIDSEFEQLLPPLSPDELANLQKSILKDGCMQPLVIWEEEGILVDGHNRYRICQAHGLEFTTRKKSFDTRAAAMCWMYESQLARRNLSPEMMSYCRGQHYQLEKKSVSNAAGVNQRNEVEAQNGPQPTTAVKLGQVYGVGKSTIKRDAKIAQALDAIGNQSPSAKTRVLSGEVKVKKKELEKLATAPAEEVKRVAKQIESGEYVSTAPPAPRTRLPSQNGDIIKDKAYYDSIQAHVRELKDPNACRTCSVEEYLMMVFSHVQQFVNRLEGLGMDSFPDIIKNADEETTAAVSQICQQAVDAISAFTISFEGDAHEKE